MDTNELIQTALRATAVYFFVLFIIRILGKREVGSVTAIDFLVALMIGEVVDEIVFGDVTMVQGGLSIVTVAAWHLANSWASYKNKTIDKITEDGPVVLVENGQIQDKNLARERINEEELWSLLRLQSVESLDQVKKATLEPGGSLSVILVEWAQPLQKGDLDRLLKELIHPPEATPGIKTS